MNWIKRLFSKKQEQVIEEKPVIKPSINNDWMRELEFESRIREYGARNKTTYTPVNKENKPSEDYTISIQQNDIMSTVNNIYMMNAIFESSSSPSFDSLPSSNVDFGGGDFGGGGSGGNW